MIAILTGHFLKFVFLDSTDLNTCDDKTFLNFGLNISFLSLFEVTENKNTF